MRLSILLLGVLCGSLSAVFVRWSTAPSLVLVLYRMAFSAALLAPCEMISFVDSMVAPLSLINALLVALAHRMGTDVSTNFAELEDIWNEYGVSGKMDDE